MIKAMIVDDKMASIELLKWLISQHCPEISLVGQACSVEEAIPIIREREPDILFLDIQMPKQNGFDLLSGIGKWEFEVVFTTAYNEFAIQAIRYSALDYLLKPIDAGDLVKAVERFKVKRIYAPAGEELYRNFIQNLSNKEKKLALTGVTDIHYVSLDEIIRLQAERNYTRFYFTDAKTFVSARTLKEYEELLPSDEFIRTHRTHLINKRFVSQYDREGFLLLKDGSRVEVSRRKKEQVLRLLG